MDKCEYCDCYLFSGLLCRVLIMLLAKVSDLLLESIVGALEFLEIWFLTLFGCNINYFFCFTITVIK